MKENVSGKVKLGVQCFADALLVIPRTLAENSGFDAQETLLKVVEAHEKTKEPYGVDVITGDPMPVTVSNVWDNYIVKR
jgi:T-complex protein 1 subunit zeta